MLAAALVAMVTLLIGADILSRALFARPLRGVAELVTLAVPAGVFLVLPCAWQRGALVRAGFVARWLATSREASARGLEMVFALIGVAVTLAIALVTLPLAWRALRDGEFLGVAGDFTVPSWPALAAIVLGSLVLTLHLARGGRTQLAWLWRRAHGAVPLALVALALLFVPFLLIDSRHGIGALAVALLLVLIALGMPVAFALLAVAAVGIAALKSSVVIAANALGLAAGGAVSSYVFGAVPLFVLLGLVMGRADIGRDALAAAHWMLRGVAGGLGVATVLANALFAAMTGISIASAAIFGKVAVPPLVEQGYAPRFAVGLVAGSSVLGMLIPPSLLLIIYGLIAEVSISALFLAAVTPGIVLTLAFAFAVVVAAWRRPPRVAGAATSMAGSGGEALRRLTPIVLLGAAVLGGIYGGLFTPTEAGAAGSLLAFTIALAMRRLRWRAVGTLLIECAVTSGAILFLVIAASAFGMLLTLSGIPAALGAAVAAAGFGLAAYAVLYLIVLILLGMVLDSTSILLIMVPLALPTVQALGGDLVWFGVLTVIGVEIGLLTPPLGLSVFTLQAALDDTRIALGDIFRGAAPFAVLMLLLCLLLIAVPQLVRPFG